MCIRDRPNNRVTVRITKLKETLLAVLANRDEIKAYWGYRVTVSNVPFRQLVKSRLFDLVVATSRLGVNFDTVKGELARRWKKSRTVLVAFGAPTQGLYEILARERIRLDEVAHFTVNTIPNQGTETVRTEEALYATLAIFNVLAGE